MSNTRKIFDNLNKSTSNITAAFYLEPDEAKKLILPIGVCIVTAGVLAFPSVAYAVFAHSLLPTYTFRALCVGSFAGGGAVIAGRYMNKNKEPVPDNKEEIDSEGYVALVSFKGVIDDLECADKLIPALKKAFEDQNAKGIVLKLNSPGGSSVQSSIIHDEILKLKKKYQKKIVVVGEDNLASGAYYIAASADSIYVNPNTITGSIGVVSQNYGYSELAKKWGIESRSYTAGVNKHRLNAMHPEKKEDVEKMKEILTDIHQNFIAAVKEGRKDKLKADADMLFSGDFWTGKKALELGLVDQLGNLSDALEKEFNVTRYKEYKKDSSVGLIKILRDLMPASGIVLPLPCDENQLKLRM